LDALALNELAKRPIKNRNFALDQPGLDFAYDGAVQWGGQRSLTQVAAQNGFSSDYR
jgi:hypothetical protein